MMSTEFTSPVARAQGRFGSGSELFGYTARSDEGWGEDVDENALHGQSEFDQDHFYDHNQREMEPDVGVVAESENESWTEEEEEEEDSKPAAVTTAPVARVFQTQQHDLNEDAAKAEQSPPEAKASCSPSSNSPSLSDSSSPLPRSYFYRSASHTPQVNASLPSTPNLQHTDSGTCHSRICYAGSRISHPLVSWRLRFLLSPSRHRGRFV